MKRNLSKNGGGIENRLKDLYNETDLIWDDPEKIRKIFTPLPELLKFPGMLKR